MIRDISLLSGQRFDVLVVGGGIHGLTIAYDAAQRGLSVALVERGDLGSGSSFNHAKTVHGGLRSLQTGDVLKARFSMGERRAMARIAPNLVEPVRFMMATTRKITRSALALRTGFLVDATIGFDRHSGVVPWLRLPAGRVVSRHDYDEAFGANARSDATGGALWCDYHMPHTERLTLAFAMAAAHHGAVLANYVEATAPVRAGQAVTGVRAVDRVTGAELVIDARCVVSASGGSCARWMVAMGGRPTFPLIKAMNVVTSRPAGEVGIGSPTSGGRLLLLSRWHGRALIGTSHSESPVEPGDDGVSAAELGLYLDEVNSAFPALALTAADVTLVHRGVVPGERERHGTLGLMGHHIVHDHTRDGVSGAVSVIGVKYTTARGVAQQVVDRVVEHLGVGRRPCRTDSALLPGAFARPMSDELEEAARHSAGVLSSSALQSVVATHGTAWRAILDLCGADAALALPVTPDSAIPAAVLVHAVRHEMARTLTDVVVRRAGIGVAGRPDFETVAACTQILARELGWTNERQVAEQAELDRFYALTAPSSH
jgi:glycerol-3-phosphate dehydrogenase